MSITQILILMALAAILWLLWEVRKAERGPVFDDEMNPQSDTKATQVHGTGMPTTDDTD